MASIGLKRPDFFMIKEYFKNSKVTVFEQEGAHLAVLSQESFRIVWIFYYLGTSAFDL